MKTLIISLLIAFLLSPLILSSEEKDHIFPEDTVASAKKIIKIDDIADSLIFKPYGSIRMNVGASFDGLTEVQNGASRIGLHGKTMIIKDLWAVVQVELGLRIVDNERKLVYSGDPGGSIQEFDNTITTRLGVLGVDTKWGSLTWGKQISPYYNVASLTDELSAFGGEASGAFNLGDGSISATGRASYSSQYNNKFGPIEISLQLQHRTLTENNKKFSDSYVGSVVYESDFGFTCGFAYAKVLDGVEQPTILQPKKGDEAGVVGAAFKNKHFQFGAVYSVAHNHDEDGSGVDTNAVFFDNYGIELFAEYTLNKIWAAYAGYNYLKPFDNYKGQYKIDYSALGVKYSFINASFVFVEVKFENSLTYDGRSGRPSVVACGMFYNF